MVEKKGRRGVDQKMKKRNRWIKGWKREKREGEW